MTDTPWTGDACSLVDAFRSGERSPVEETAATLAAIERSDLNAFSFVDPERALDAARRADVHRPFGGVPIGVKELDTVAGWPDTGASLVFKDRIATTTGTAVGRLMADGGAVPVGLTTASEFGGLNVSVTRLNGVTHNPWRHGSTCGGSSGGSASAVVGGLVSLATGGDGGGSIRIPAGYTGLLGMKGTYGRLPRGPHAFFRPGTVVLGCLARSVRDAARHFDVCAGPDLLDPSSLPPVGGWEAGLGTHDLRGKRFAVVVELGGTPVEAGTAERVRAAAAQLAEATGMVQVDITLKTPNLAAQWMMGNLSTLLVELGDHWPRHLADLTGEIAVGALLSRSLYNIEVAARAEAQRLEAYAAMAAAFEQVDFIVAATNPSPAFPADSTTSATEANFIDWALSNTASRYAFRGVLAALRVATGAYPRLPNLLVDAMVRRFPDLVAMGGLTIISNVYGNPAVSIPAGFVDGLPVGMQVLTRHHDDALLFDLALAAERVMPWPMVADRPVTARR